MSDQLPVYVHLLPALIGSGTLHGGIAVVVDVLRATTAMIHALNSGIDCIIPCLEVSEARAIAAEFAPETALLGGERHGLPIDGFNLGNSPSSYTPEVCRAKTLVMTTTNGTKAILSSLEAERVLVAAFANLRSTVDEVERFRGPAHIVCAGTDGAISLEDTLLAGAIVAALGGGGRGFGNDSAQIAAEFWRASQAAERPLPEVIAHGRGGRRVREIGLGNDIDDAGRVDRFQFVAELDRRRVPLRIVRN